MHSLSVQIQGISPQVIAAELKAIAERLQGECQTIVGERNNDDYQAKYRFDVNKALLNEMAK